MRFRVCFVLLTLAFAAVSCAPIATPVPLATPAPLASPSPVASVATAARETPTARAVPKQNDLLFIEFFAIT